MTPSTSNTPSVNTGVGVSSSVESVKTGLGPWNDVSYRRNSKKNVKNQPVTNAKQEVNGSRFKVLSNENGEVNSDTVPKVDENALPDIVKLWKSLQEKTVQASSLGVTKTSEASGSVVKTVMPTVPVGSHKGKGKAGASSGGKSNANSKSVVAGKNIPFPAMVSRTSSPAVDENLQQSVQSSASVGKINVARPVIKPVKKPGRPRKILKDVTNGVSVKKGETNVDVPCEPSDAGNGIRFHPGISALPPKAPDPLDPGPESHPITMAIASLVVGDSDVGNQAASVCVQDMVSEENVIVPAGINDAARRLFY